MKILLFLYSLIFTHDPSSFGRTFPYIRLSITDVCNFKCGYCLPNGYQVDKSDNRKFLHLDEIKRLAKVFSKLGVWTSKIRSYWWLNQLLEKIFLI